VIIDTSGMMTQARIPCHGPLVCELFMDRVMRGAGAVLSLVALVSMFFPVLLSSAETVGPMELVKQAVAEARAIFNDSRLTQESRIESLKRLAEERFDFEEMSKRALATQWRKLTPGERKEFVSLFSELIEDTYSNKIRRYEQEIKREAEDKILYIGEYIDGSYATVRTKIVTTKGTEVAVDYRFIREGVNWRVYDVVVEGVSFVNNYRTQFNEIIRAGSYGELVKRLKEKVRG
jgi:phospholipid transport system substrate-binding protein